MNSLEVYHKSIYCTSSEDICTPIPTLCPQSMTLEATIFKLKKWVGCDNPKILFYLEHLNISKK